jgi:hypothetical protein
MEAKSGDESKAIVVNEEKLFDYAPDYYRKIVPSEIGDIISVYACDNPNDFEKWLERVELVFRVMNGIRESFSNSYYVNAERGKMVDFSILAIKENGEYFQYSFRGDNPNQVVNYHLTISEYVEEIKIGLDNLNDWVDRKFEYWIQVELEFDDCIYCSGLDEISDSIGITWEHTEDNRGPDSSTYENEELRLTIECTFWKDPRCGCRW